MRRPMSANFDDPKSPAFVACRSDLASYQLLAEPMLPVVEESLTQVAAGPSTINVALASLEQLWLGRIRIHAPSVGVTVLHPSVFAFILTAATDECRINGELAQASRVYMPGAQHGFYIRGGRRESIGVAVPRSPLVETVAALQGVDADDVVLDARSFEVRPRDTAHLRRAVDRTFESTSASDKRGPLGGECSNDFVGDPRMASRWPPAQSGANPEARRRVGADRSKGGGAVLRCRRTRDFAGRLMHGRERESGRALPRVSRGLRRDAAWLLPKAQDVQGSWHATPRESATRRGQTRRSLRRPDRARTILGRVSAAVWRIPIGHAVQRSIRIGPARERAPHTMASQPSSGTRTPRTASQ